MISEATRHLVQVWIGAVIILSIYSFLYNDNKVYRTVLNLCIGIGAGYLFMITWRQVLGPLWWDKMWANMLTTTHAPTQFGCVINCIKEHAGAFIYFVFLGLMGSLWYFQSSRKFLWLARIPIGLALGAGAGVVFKAQFIPNVSQMIDSARPLLSAHRSTVWPNGQPWIGSGLPVDLWQTFSNILFVVAIVTVMVYFFFSFEHRGKAIKRTAGTGRWMLMICFGGFFGNTIMTRMAILLQNIQFLRDDWGPTRIPVLFNMANWTVALILIAVGTVIYLVSRALKPKKPQGPSSSEPEDETAAATA